MSSPTFPRFVPCGDAAVLVEFGTEIDLATNAQVTRFADAVRAAALPGVIQVIAAYCSALVEYDPLVWPGDSLDRRLQALLPAPGVTGDAIAGADPTEATADGAAADGAPTADPTAAGADPADPIAPRHQPSRVIDIPTLYDGEDLPAIAAHTGLSVDQVIARHSGAIYTVYATGFSPGFAFLGGLPPELATPRLPTPRAVVPAGSVAIGGQQTGIYPRPSPGGWRLLGRTYVPLFDPDRPEPALLQPGDQVRFIPISAAAFADGAASCSA